MIRPVTKHFVALLTLVTLVGGYVAYRWRSVVPPPERQNRPIVAATELKHALSNLPTTLISPADEPVRPKSAMQLHAAFRKAQQCVQERFVIRQNSFEHTGTVPPHIAGCDDMRGALRMVYEATKTAAAFGDIDAQMCYLMQMAGDREMDFWLSEAEIAEYKLTAPPYVSAAFKRGDWRVVNLLGYHVVDWAGLFINLDQWKDPAREYRAHQLFLLGAGDVDAQDGDSWLVALRMPNHTGSNLSPQEIQDSDAWVQETYDKYFISQPKLLSEPEVCTLGDGRE